ncbi:MAG: hypothetical protein CMO44_14695, partial [Verrucomicrobiales bacterium]|nr:hypothetical protein [Verrucomicrobiales bacterium]
MKKFDFLTSAWGVTAKENAIAEISANVEGSLNQKSIQEYIKDSDIRKLGLTSSLLKELTKSGDCSLPPGR